MTEWIAAEQPLGCYLSYGWLINSHITTTLLENIWEISLLITMDTGLISDVKNFHNDIKLQTVCNFS
jgi:hypothetical protein